MERLSGCGFAIIPLQINTSFHAQELKKKFVLQLHSSMAEGYYDYNTLKLRN